MLQVLKTILQEMPSQVVGEQQKRLATVPQQMQTQYFPDPKPKHKRLRWKVQANLKYS